MTTPRRRRSIRLASFDYATHGAYFVTICAHQRRCVFGDIAGDEPRLSEAGERIAGWWSAISTKFPRVETDEFVVMPNHVHGVLWILDEGGRVGAPVPGDSAPNDEGGRVGPPLPGDVSERVDPTPTSLPRIVQWFKTMTANEYLRAAKRVGARDGRLWQRNYYEHVIRNDESLHQIRQYIRDNPRKWAEDEENPENARRA